MLGCEVVVIFQLFCIQQSEGLAPMLALCLEHGPSQQGLGSLQFCLHISSLHDQSAMLSSKCGPVRSSLVMLLAPPLMPAGPSKLPVKQLLSGRRCHVVRQAAPAD